MIDEELKTILKEKHGKLNFNGLVKHMEDSSIDFRINKLRGVMGIATFYCIYLDIERFNDYHDILLYFVILHEMGHYKRIENAGKEEIIRLLSLEEFDEFFSHVITEEITADRYACLTFYLLNNFNFPREATQQLHKVDRQNRYKETAKSLFGQIQNNEEKYKQLLESFLI